MANAIGLGKSKGDGQAAPAAVGNWRAALEGHPSVIVWLRSGTKLTGVVTDPIPVLAAPDKRRGHVLSR